jgi:hypothetical protein
MLTAAASSLKGLSSRPSEELIYLRRVSKTIRWDPPMR